MCLLNTGREGRGDTIPHPLPSQTFSPKLVFIWDLSNEDAGGDFCGAALSSVQAKVTASKCRFVDAALLQSGGHGRDECPSLMSPVHQIAEKR